MKAKQSGNAFIPFPRFWNIRGKTRKYIIYAILAAFLLNAAFLVLSSHYRYPAFRQYLYDYQSGAVAERTLVAEQTIRYVDNRETEELRTRRAQSVPPVYTIRETKILEAVRELDDISALLNASPPPSPAELRRNLQENFGLDLGPQEASYLLDEEGRRRVLPVAEQLLHEILSRGVLPENPQLGSHRQIELWRWEEGKKVNVTLTEEDLLKPGDVPGQVRDGLSGLSLPETAEESVRKIVTALAGPTAYYNSSVTEAKRQEARESVRPVTGRIFEGDMIIEKGEIITAEDMQKIEIIRQHTPRLEMREVVATLLFLVGIFFLGYVLAAPLMPGSHRTRQYAILLLAISVVFSLNITVVVIFSLIPPNLIFALGVLTVYYAMLVSILVRRRVGVIISLLLSFLLLTLPDVEMYSFLFSFFAGIFSSYIIQNAQKRIDLVTGTVKIAAAVTALLVVIGLMREESAGWFITAAGVGIINVGISGALLVATLPIFEHMLNAPTVFRLRELSDTNTPIFKRMITIAPGTYSHSVGVAHLAESACREIGANELVARVGAYYHDIGKLDQPEYFIENQTDYNRHDDLSPNLSAAVIKSHVKLGKEKAKELKLPPEIVEIVADHHGSDVINYFYHQAKEQAKGPVGPEKYSYNGVPPRSKEAAVVMLADTIEAQSRTVKKPTMQRFEKMVWDAIMYKFNNKQLSNCDLSMKELELIKRSFVQILAGQFHSRIEYPNTRELG